jgi:tetratricopeptide (TPR) repeat protein
VPNVVQSIAYFRQAIAADSTFARAHAALSLAYVVLGNYVADPRDTLPPLIRARAERALALDSTLADVQLAYAGSLAVGLQFESSVRHYRRALEIDPASGDVRLAYGFQLLTSGNGDDAIRELREAVRLDPLVPSARAALALAYLFARRYPEAIAASQALVAQLPQFPLGYYSLAVALAMQGQADSAVRVMERTFARRK